jgi:hypothetical protein
MVKSMGFNIAHGFNRGYRKDKHLHNGFNRFPPRTECNSQETLTFIACDFYP